MTLLAEGLSVARLTFRCQGSHAGKVPMVAYEIRFPVIFRKQGHKIPVTGLAHIRRLPVVVTGVAGHHTRQILAACQICGFHSRMACLARNAIHCDVFLMGKQNLPNSRRSGFDVLGVCMAVTTITPELFLMATLTLLVRASKPIGRESAFFGGRMARQAVHPQILDVFLVGELDDRRTSRVPTGNQPGAGGWSIGHRADDKAQPQEESKSSVMSQHREFLHSKMFSR